MANIESVSSLLEGGRQTLECEAGGAYSWLRERSESVQLIGRAFSIALKVGRSVPCGRVCLHVSPREVLPVYTSRCCVFILMKTWSLNAPTGRVAEEPGAVLTTGSPHCYGVGRSTHMDVGS